MEKSVSRDLLSIGVILVIVALSVFLGGSGLIGWGWVPPLFIVLCGFWVIALAEMQVANLQKYGRSAFSLVAWGALLIAIGCAWFVYHVSWVYSAVIILLVLAAVSITTALRRK